MTKLFLKLALLCGFNVISVYNWGGTAGANFWQTASSCSITTIEPQSQSTCDPATNTYSQDLIISYVNEPASGTLEVNGSSFAITGSPQLVTLNGLISDGQPVDVTASFSDSINCSLTEFDLFTAPEECVVCMITDLEAGFQTGCDPATNTYTQEITVSYANEPLSGQLEVNGQFFPITGSPQTVTLNGLVANGLEVSVTARFSANTVCSFTEASLFTSPEVCFEVCSIQAVLAGAQSGCNTDDNTYSQQIVVVYQNAPTNGSLQVNGQSFPIIGSPQTVVLRGLTSDGNEVDVTASFSDLPACTFTEAHLFTAPEECQPNVAPIAEHDTLTIESEVSVDINILGNDVDTDGNLDPGSVLIVDAPANGSLILSPDGQISYIPNLGFSGIDSFSYTVQDNEGAVSNLASVVITVELLTTLDHSDPVDQGVTMGSNGQDVFINVNRNKVSKMAIELIDVQGQIVHQSVYNNNIQPQYRLAVPGIYRQNLLLIRVKTNFGNFSQKFILGGS